MKKVKYRLFWVWQFDEEENWINEMAEAGWNLTKVGFAKYTFEDGTPGEYQYRLEFLGEKPDNAQSQDCIAFLEETGAQYIGEFNRWVYLRKKTDDGPFELFSDIASSIEYLQKRKSWLIPLLISMSIIVFCNLFVGICSVKPLNICCALILLALCTRLAVEVSRIVIKVKRLKKDSMIQE